MKPLSKMDLTIEMRSLKSAQLDHPMADSEKREVLPMSTLIASNEWHLEAAWDGVELGDVQVYRNETWRNEKETPTWIWWGGVPRGRIVSYRWAGDPPAPQAYVDPNGKRKEEPGTAPEASAEQRNAKVAR